MERRTDIDETLQSTDRYNVNHAQPQVLEDISCLDNVNIEVLEQIQLLKRLREKFENYGG